MPSAWEGEEPATIATVKAILEERAERVEG